MRTIMDLKQLRYFMAIVEERQITAAARRLHMAQPPLSNQMKMLEDEIGLKLFQRGPHHIELTEAGELLAARAAQLLDMAAMTKRELKDFRQGLCGTLAIGTVSSLVHRTASSYCLTTSGLMCLPTSFTAGQARNARIKPAYAFCTAGACSS